MENPVGLWLWVSLMLILGYWKYILAAILILVVVGIVLKSVFR